MCAAHNRQSCLYSPQTRASIDREQRPWSPCTWFPLLIVWCINYVCAVSGSVNLSSQVARTKQNHRLRKPLKRIKQISFSWCLSVSYKQNVLSMTQFDQDSDDRSHPEGSAHQPPFTSHQFLSKRQHPTGIISSLSPNDITMHRPPRL